MFGGNIQLASNGDSCSGYWDISGTDVTYSCVNVYDFFGSLAITDAY